LWEKLGKKSKIKTTEFVEKMWSKKVKVNKAFFFYCVYKVIPKKAKISNTRQKKTGME
jgi:hypothetical protein